MKENQELLEHIYQDAEMSCFTLKKLLEDLKEKDNKIKDAIEDLLEEYHHFQEEAEECLINEHCEVKKEGFMAKMGADMGIKKEVEKDNSDASIADMLIKGISMGSLDMEKKLKTYGDKVNKDCLSLAKKFMTFQEKSIEKLKSYL